MEVDYDKNITQLYYAISHSKWEEALDAVHHNPHEAMTWVVRYHPGKKKKDPTKSVMWRFLPLHSACARDPPSQVIEALLKAYPEGVQCPDNQGMVPLHYACSNQASRDVVRRLLVAYSPAAQIPDPRGMLPLHYLACWGPSTIRVLDMLVVAYRDALHRQDQEGKTPLDLAMDGDNEEVIAALKRWRSVEEQDNGNGNGNNNSPKSSPVSPSRKATPKSPSNLKQPLKPSPTSVILKNLEQHAQSSSQSHHHPRITVSDDELDLAFSLTKSFEPPPHESEFMHTQEIDESVITEQINNDSFTDDGMEDGTEGEDEQNGMLVSKLRAELADVKTSKSFTIMAGDDIDDEVKCYQHTINLLHEQLADARKETFYIVKEKDAMEKELELTHVDANGVESRLDDITREYERYKDISDSMGSQMTRLSTSLTALLKKQECLLSSADIKEASRRRKDKLRELLEAEESQYSDDRLEQFEEQKREMKSIAILLKKVTVNDE
jgi:ankyrin repeat protein